MGTLTIRNLDDDLKSRLRLRAAVRNGAMEDEVRHILRSALDEPATPATDLGARIKARFGGLIDAPLPVPERESVRSVPDFAATSTAPRRPAANVVGDAQPARL